MIRYFDRNEINFNHNETILSPLSCYVTEEANGMYELEAEFTKNVNIAEGDIIKAPSPRGSEQLFRIYRVKKSLKGKTAYARHIFYDLAKNFIINLELNNISVYPALQSVLNNCETSHNFVAKSDVLSQNTATYTRINPIQAIIGEENSILNLWGGNLIRNNHEIQIKANGTDRGYQIRLGKNLIAIDAEIDESSVKTRIYPYAELDDSSIVLPEKYVDSPLIHNYGEPIIYTEEIRLTDEQKVLPANDIYEIMRDYCNELFTTYNVDKPSVNYKIDFVELSKTEQYKKLAILEQIDLYDIVTVNVSHLDINVKARCIKYKYDCLKERYDSIELGDFSAKSSYSTENIVAQLRSGIKASQSAAEYATNVITGNKGGYVVTRRYPNGKPYEILIMDTEDINTATNVFRLNNSGLGFSRNGYNGTFGTAMTIDGHIVADYIDTGVLKSILLQSDNYILGSSGMQINLSDGVIDSKNFKVSSQGNIYANNAIMNNGDFSGTINATGGTLHDLIVDGTLTGGTIQGSTINTISGNIGGWSISSNGLSSFDDNASINIFKDNLVSSKINSSGLHLYNYLKSTNDYLGGIVVSSIENINGASFVHALSGEYLAFGSIDATTPTANAPLDIAFYYNKNKITGTNFSANAGVHFNKIVYLEAGAFISGNVSIGGYTPITTGNRDNYTYNPKTHTHDTSSDIYASPYVSSTGNYDLVDFANTTGSDMIATGGFVVTKIQSASDRRLKQNIVELKDVTDKYMKLQTVEFEYKKNVGNQYIHCGYVAQDVAEVFPEDVYDLIGVNNTEISEAQRELCPTGIYEINYNNLHALHTKMIQKHENVNQELLIVTQEQQILINKQADEINELKLKLNEIELRLNKLEVA
jgi:phage minor structural protein